ncbi:phage baseplate assembly protein V [Pseudomonas sp. URMO17WK12:I1]|uniref:phage baseplate assembly protein V n=1 Tax=unclassified Pseudomonas TaxID=196821 RepID=UPI0004854C5E|nr:MULTISPECIES: phage baseplate assembly protein [unclassified Pseudomonas]PZW65268.1 phage baseplate assembly protein V [Pseudomonas sp. URMO17WK12:I1]
MSQGMFARCAVALANARTKMQTLQVRLFAGEIKDGVEHFEPYGFTARPHEGAEGIALFLGDRSHGVVVCVADRRFRLKELEPGEVALYTDEGDRFHFKRGRRVELETLTLHVTASEGVEFDTPEIRTTGRIVSAGDQVAGGVSQINHPHEGVQRGSDQTGKPVGG